MPIQHPEPMADHFYIPHSDISSDMSPVPPLTPSPIGSPEPILSPLPFQTSPTSSLSMESVDIFNEEPTESILPTSIPVSQNSHTEDIDNGPIDIMTSNTGLATTTTKDSSTQTTSKVYIMHNTMQHFYSYKVCFCQLIGVIIVYTSKEGDMGSIN